MSRMLAEAEPLDACSFGAAMDAKRSAAIWDHFRHERQSVELEVGVEGRQDFFQAPDRGGRSASKDSCTVAMFSGCHRGHPSEVCHAAPDSITRQL